MNRNQESHFAHVPNLSKPRSSFDRSKSLSTSFSFGSLIPIYCSEILPGDTVSIKTSKIARLQTLLTPVYGNMYLDTYWFYVPNRIIWNHWKQFMGENTESAWVPQREYVVPGIGAPSGGFDYGTLADYFQYPLKQEWDKDSLHAPSALPFRAYAAIFNDFFRDQNINDPLVINFGDNNVDGSNGSGISDVEKGGQPIFVNKFHDMFTACLPQPQKGPSVYAPIYGTIPVVASTPHFKHDILTNVPSDPEHPGYRAVPMMFGHLSADGERVINDFGYNQSSADVGVTQTSVYKSYDISDWESNIHGSWDQKFPVNLVATTGLYGSNINPSDFGIDINSLRLSIITQQYYEALSRSGSRMEEQILTFFGVSNPDSRIQHPEYLGGNRVQINVREISNTTQTDTDFLGDVGGQSVTADSHGDFSKSFTEHGLLIGLCCARYDHLYPDGIPRQFMRRTKFDFYNPLFANIGEQPIYDYEIYATPETLNGGVFGYNEAWIHYRTDHSSVTGHMRPKHNSSLAHWTLADNYVSRPILSTNWLRESPDNVDRVLSVPSTHEHQIFADFYFDAKYTRVMPAYSVPGQMGSF